MVNPECEHLFPPCDHLFSSAGSPSSLIVCTTYDSIAFRLFPLVCDDSLSPLLDVRYSMFVLLDPAPIAPFPSPSPFTPTQRIFEPYVSKVLQPLMVSYILFIGLMMHDDVLCFFIPYSYFTSHYGYGYRSHSKPPYRTGANLNFDFLITPQDSCSMLDSTFGTTIFIFTFCILTATPILFIPY